MIDNSPHSLSDGHKSWYRLGYPTFRQNAKVGLRPTNFYYLPPYHLAYPLKSYNKKRVPITLKDTFCTRVSSWVVLLFLEPLRHPYTPDPPALSRLLIQTASDYGNTLLDVRFPSKRKRLRSLMRLTRTCMRCN